MKNYCIIISLFFLLIGCKTKDDVFPSPIIEKVNHPERILPLAPVAFQFSVRAEAGLQSITVRHVHQNVIFINKTDNFDSPVSDSFDIKHTTGFESVGQKLDYEITVTDNLNRKSIHTISMQVDPSQVTMQVKDDTQDVQAIRKNQTNTVQITVTSTTSLNTLLVYSLGKDGEKGYLFYHSNIQTMSKDYIVQHYSRSIELTPTEEISAYEFFVEDHAGAKKLIVIPVQ
jgi:hypothetical protein